VTLAEVHHLWHVMTWKAAAATMVATTAWVALAASPSRLMLSIAAAAAAASAAFLFDDPAAVTLAPSPLVLRRRRAHRVALALLGIGAWWGVVVALLSRRLEDLPIAAPTLQLAVLTTIALAASLSAGRLTNDTIGGTAGALTVLACFGSGCLPHRWWWFLSSDPTAPDATTHLAVALAIALAVQFAATTDRAHRRTFVRRGSREPRRPLDATEVAVRVEQTCRR